MNICTIATEGAWLNKHLPRWVRQIKNNNKDFKLYLILAIDNEEILHPRHETIREFEDVKVYPLSVADRPWFNEVRMGATEIFGVDEMLYLDCDCDVIENIEDIPKKSDKPLMFVKSPAIHKSFFNISQKLGHGMPDWMGDNCLLYMREDFTERYKNARRKVRKVKNEPRVVGTANFNIMLRENPDIWDVLPKEYGTIWWQADKWLDAKIIQYCNDTGQEKRLKLEEIWEDAK